MVLKPIRMTSLHIAGIAAHAGERNPRPTDRNIHISSNLKRSSTGSNSEALKKGKKTPNVMNHSVAACSKMCQTMTESSFYAGIC